MGRRLQQATETKPSVHQVRLKLQQGGLNPKRGERLSPPSLLTLTTGLVKDRPSVHFSARSGITPCCNSLCDRLLSQALTHDSTHSRRLRFSEHHQEQTCEDVNANVFVTVVGLLLSAVEYERLFHPRHDGRDRTGKVDHGIIFSYCAT